MSNYIEKLQEAGIKTGSADGRDIYKVTPAYNGNCGFFHIKTEMWELILIKGVFKDNIRHLSGDCPLKTKILNDIAQTSADAERSLRKPISLSIWLDDSEKPNICDVQKYTVATADDLRNYHIDSPVTPVESSLGRGDFINDKYLFSRNPFVEIFPEVLSPFAISVASGMPDVFNPLFMSCSIKTQSPSVKILFGRPLLNISNVDTIVPAFKQTTDFFLLNFAPNIYKTVKKPVLGTPDDSDMAIEDAEIEEALSDIRESTDSLAIEDILSDDFTELTALTVMTWEMIYMRLWREFTALHKITGKSISDTLRHIYMTRSDTILNREYNDLCTRFDPASESVNTKSCGLKHQSADEMYKSFSRSKRLAVSKSRYTEKLNSLHKYLRMRDDLYITTARLTSRIRVLLLDAGRGMVENQILTDENDIFFFEKREIKDIINDEYFGSVPFTISFKRWQTARFGALCLPFSLYEKDVERVQALSDTQIRKSEETKSVGSLSFFNKEITTENYSCAGSFSLEKISNLGKTEAVITESASLFSFITEYCSVKGIPLHIGARFSPLLLSRSITLHENEISYE